MGHTAVVSLLTLMLASGESHEVSNCSTVVVTGAAVHSGTYENDTTVTDGSTRFVMETGNQTSYLERTLGFRRIRSLAEMIEGSETSMPDDRVREDGSVDERSSRVPDVVDPAYTAAAARKALDIFCPTWRIRGFDVNDNFFPPLFTVDDSHLHPVDIVESWGGVACATCTESEPANVAIVCAEEVTTTAETSSSWAARDGFTRSLVPTFAVGAIAVVAAAVSHVVILMA